MQRVAWRVLSATNASQGNDGKQGLAADMSGFGALQPHAKMRSDLPLLAVGDFGFGAAGSWEVRRGVEGSWEGRGCGDGGVGGPCSLSNPDKAVIMVVSESGWTWFFRSTLPPAHGAPQTVRRDDDGESPARGEPLTTLLLDLTSPIRTCSGIF